VKDYRFVWEYSTDFSNIEETLNVNHVRNIPKKIKFTKDRIKKFEKWICKRDLNKLRLACIEKLTAQLEFLEYIKDLKLKKILGAA
jgi:hypothetical protein